MSTLKACVDAAAAEGKGPDAILRAARDWMLNEKRAARVIPERADSLPPLPPAPHTGRARGRKWTEEKVTRRS